jgi:hypothetical protein
MGSFVVVWFLMAIPAQIGTGPVSEVFRYLDFRSHFLTMSTGVLELTDILYFVSATALFLLIGAVSMETRRWR